MATKYLDSTGLTYLWSKIKTWVGTYASITTSGGTSSLTVGNTTVVVPNKTSQLTNDSGYITSADVPEGATASTTTPKMDGTAAVGTETAFARGDHRHPSDTAKADKVSGATNGNLAALDANGNLTDSGVSATTAGTDTKNTAGSTNDTSKLYIVGAKSQAANPQTYSRSTAYIGTDGHLYSNSSKVLNTAQLGAANGVCPLDNNSLIDSQYLPSYVDDVIEGYPYGTELSRNWLFTEPVDLSDPQSSGIHIEPETGKIYVLMADSTNYNAGAQFRWGGTTYVKLNDGGISSITNAEIDAITAN